MTSDDLKIMQSWSLDRKIQVSQTRILEWINYYGENNVYVSFSGGKDSTVLLDLCRRICPFIPAVFVDTGLEYPEIKQFVKSKENVIILTPEMNFRQVINLYGYPVVSKKVARMIYDCQNVTDKNKVTVNLYKTGLKKDGSVSKYFKLPNKYIKLIDSSFRVSHKCCDIMKKNPLHKYEKQTHKKAIVGTMCSESFSRTQGWFKTGCNAFNSSYPKSMPLSFWTESDILEYIHRFNLPYCSVYGDIVFSDGKYSTTGEKRTGCMFCMFGIQLEKSPNRFERMKESHPSIYNYCINNLGCGSILDFLNIPY